MPPPKQKRSISCRRLFALGFLALALIWCFFIVYTFPPISPTTPPRKKPAKYNDLPGSTNDLVEYCLQFGSGSASEYCFETTDAVAGAGKAAVNACGDKGCAPHYLIVSFGTHCATAAGQLDVILRAHASVVAPELADDDAITTLRKTIRAIDKFGQASKAVKNYIAAFPRSLKSGQITGDVAMEMGAISVEAAENFHKLNPHMRVIFALCDPVARAYSEHMLATERAKGDKDGWGVRAIDEYYRNPSFGSACFASQGCLLASNEDGDLIYPDGAADENGRDDDDDAADDGIAQSYTRDPKGWNKKCSASCQRLGGGVYSDWIIGSWLQAGFHPKQLFLMGVEALAEAPVETINKIERFLGIATRGGDEFKPLEILSDPTTLIPQRITEAVYESDVGSFHWQTSNYLSQFYHIHNQRLDRYLRETNTADANSAIHIKMQWRKPEAYPQPDSNNGLRRHCIDYKGSDRICYRTSNLFKNPCFYYQGERRCFPYFTIVGWPKCGTSSLYFYLTNHSQVEPPRVKETDYFSHWSTLADPVKRAYPPYYAGLMPKIRDATHVTGEASTKTGPNTDAPHRQFQLLPFARVIIVLRDPVEQLYSNFLMSMRASGGFTNAVTKPYTDEFDKHVREIWATTACFKSHMCGVPESFFGKAGQPASPADYSAYKTAVAEGQMWKNTCSFECVRLGWGVYVDWMEMWHGIYPKEQIHIIRSQDLELTPLAAMRALETFLGLHPHDYKDILSRAVNTKERPDIYNVTSFDHFKEQRLKDAREDPIRLSRPVLTQFYHPHTLRLEAYLERKFEFSRWDEEEERVIRVKTAAELANDAKERK